MQFEYGGPSLIDRCCCSKSTEWINQWFTAIRGPRLSRILSSGITWDNKTEIRFQSLSNSDKKIKSRD